MKEWFIQYVELHYLYKPNYSKIVFFFFLNFDDIETHKYYEILNLFRIFLEKIFRLEFCSTFEIGQLETSLF